MPRSRRNFLDRVPLHIVNRGNRKQRTFLTDADYIGFLGGIVDAMERTVVGLIAFCVVTPCEVAGTLGASHLSRPMAQVQLPFSTPRAPLFRPVRVEGGWHLWCQPLTRTVSDPTNRHGHW